MVRCQVIDKYVLLTPCGTSRVVQPTYLVGPPMGRPLMDAKIFNSLTLDFEACFRFSFFKKIIIKSLSEGSFA